MYLDLINDLFVNSSVFYLYFGILLISIGATQLIGLQFNIRKTKISFNTDDHKQIKINDDYFDSSLIMLDYLINWFVKTFKRIDKLVDDNEDAFSSYFNNNFKIRGGLLWNMYSLRLKNIGFSF